MRGGQRPPTGSRARYHRAAIGPFRAAVEPSDDTDRTHARFSLAANRSRTFSTLGAACIRQ